ncbi:MAG: hypothetical protein ACD_4C00249G0002 [uncultured bacterium (gcode 4)]|uniref:Tyr recombinase domain-containing protein n=1 Tax=uncultured bacterium (gcode 4) TaxID=1234023 RepID=K2FXE5_9BACT|nr:MAG: hypothetical protein ACD_4C00249G0002 [uncultured bacterium (gcode 4)]
MGTNFTEKLKSKYYSLLNKEEENLLNSKISDNETPLWIHWPEYANTYKDLWRSNVTIKRVYDCVRFFIKNTELNTIESWSFRPYNLQTRLSEISNERQWQNSTFNTYIKNMKSYLNFLEKMQLIEKSVIWDLYRKGEKPINQSITSEEEIKTILKYIENKNYASSLESYRNRLFFLICSISWARPIQLLNLTIDSFINNRTEVVISWAKQKWKTLYYKLPTAVIDVFKLYVAEVVCLERDKELWENLFLSVSQKWKPWTNEWVNKLYQRIKKDTWIHFTAYMIRRQVVTKLINDNPDSIDFTRLFMWHTRASTTMRYLQPSSKLTDKWVSILSKWLFD